MKGGANAAILIGVVSLAVGVISRLLRQPIGGVEAHAIVEFSQACFLLGIALACGGGACQPKS